jgi:hypothetical protein
VTGIQEALVSTYYLNTTRFGPTGHQQVHKL